MLKQECKTH